MKKRSEREAAHEGMTHIAFWSYDRFPYLLGAAANDLAVKDNGTVTIGAPSYGPGYRFAPRFISKDIQGNLKYLDEIDALDEEYRKAQDKLHKEFMEKAKERIPFLATHFERYKKK